MAYTNWERFYQKLNMIFHGIIASTMIPFALAFLETQREFPEGPLIEGTSAIILNGVLLVVSALMIGTSRYLGGKSIDKIRQEQDTPAKLRVYLNEKILIYATLEAAAIMSVLGLYLSKQSFFTIIYLLVLFLFSLQRPSFDRVSRETGIKEADLKTWGEKNATT